MNKALSRNEKLNLYIERANRILPGVDIASAWSLYSGDFPLSGKIDLSGTSTALKGKLIGMRTKHIIHYAPVEALVGIVKDKAIRMSNLESVNDPSEVSYSFKNIAHEATSAEMENFKRQTFLFSACKYNFKQATENFDSWYRYANKGDGVGLVFEIENLKDNWQEIYYGQVGYGLKNENQRLLEQFWEMHHSFESEYKLFENTPLLLIALTSFIKEHIWKPEKEVRLTAFCPYDKWELKAKHYERGSPFLQYSMEFGLSSQRKLIPYVYLPINIEQRLKEFANSFKDEAMAKRYLSSIPHLRLKRVIAGFGMSNNDFHEIADYVTEVAAPRLGYGIEYGYSAFRKKFDSNKT